MFCKNILKYKIQKIKAVECTKMYKYRLIFCKHIIFYSQNLFLKIQFFPLSTYFLCFLEMFFAFSNIGTSFSSYTADKLQLRSQFEVNKHDLKSPHFFMNAGLVLLCYYIDVL